MDNPNSHFITVDKDTFYRMMRALIKMEKYLEEKENNDATWVSEEIALQLLGCSKSTLYRLKGKHISYKAVGKKHQYSKKSIDKYISLMSV
jgi:hypothetical protein